MRNRLLSLLVLAVTTSLLPAGATVSAAEAIDASGTVYAGMYSSEFFSTDDLNAFANTAGKRMTFGGTFHHPLESEGSNWALNTETLLEEVWQGQATPFANLEVTVSAFTIASGGYDAQITAWAGRVKAWLDRGGGRSMFIAPLQEMNGDWVPYGMDPGNFKLAYARIQDIFAGMGVDETQVRWVFAPNGWSTPPYSQVDYYPGDDRVDVIGFSAYNFGSTLDRWASVFEVMGGVFAEARTYAPDKTYLLSQTASSQFGGDRNAWLTEMFTFVANDPNALGFVYFNLNRETDWRMWTGSSLAAGFATGMAQATTKHVWPMTSWFQPGPLPFGVEPLPGPTIPLPTQFCFSDDTGNAGFGDVPAGQFYTDPVSWAVTSGITTGFADGTFRPGDVVTRAQLAVFLWRLSCSPAVSSGASFGDVPAGQYYSDAVDWLVGTGITSGTGPGTFSPNQAVDRGQMAVFLHRLVGEPTASPAGFPDVSGQYFAAAVDWLAAEAITSGYPDGLFHPGDAVTRAQMVTFLDRFAR
jgi:hypothetical protein